MKIFHNRFRLFVRVRFRGCFFGTRLCLLGFTFKCLIPDSNWRFSLKNRFSTSQLSYIFSSILHLLLCQLRHIIILLSLSSRHEKFEFTVYLLKYFTIKITSQGFYSWPPQLVSSTPVSAFQSYWCRCPSSWFIVLAPKFHALIPAPSLPWTLGVPGVSGGWSAFSPMRCTTLSIAGAASLGPHLSWA